MKRWKLILLATAALLTLGLRADAQQDGYDIFVPVAKYIAKGDAGRLSAWFADNLEISVISSTNDASRSQARQILKNFFDTYTPRSFEINHKASKGNMKYALGVLNAGGELFLVTIFLNCKNDSYQIQQLKIERQTTIY